MKKSFIITSMAAFAALCFSLTAQAQGPVVVSDKDDYSPGEIALFSTTGFVPGELLDFSVAVGGDDATWVPDIAWTDIPADNSGNAEVDYVVPDSWANKTLQLTVMGLTSGLVATTTFTDDPALVHNVNFSTTGLPNGTSISISGTKTNPAGNFGAYGPDTFITPTSSGDEGTTPGTELTFTGFPVTVAGVGGHYSLSSFTLTPGTAPGTLHDLDVSTGSGDYTTGGQNNGGGTHATIVGNYTFVPDASPTPTPTPSATPSATPCQNHPPVIACSGNDANLGAVVGCLGTGTGFGQTFPVSYSNDGPGTTVTVTAHVTLPDTSTVDVPVATVTDPDGDTLTVTQPSGTTSVTLSGPGSDSQPFSVTIDADDGHDCNNTAETMCGGNVNATITYAFNGFFPPLSNVATTKVKQGSAVPVKFDISDCSGILITPDNLPGPTPSIVVVYQSGACPSGPPSIDDAGNSNGDTEFFRWDPTGMQWIFNLKTNSSYLVGKTYQISADLGYMSPGALISIK
jgi:hypothetical protein